MSSSSEETWDTDQVVRVEVVPGNILTLPVMATAWLDGGHASLAYTDIVDAIDPKGHKLMAVVNRVMSFKKFKQRFKETSGRDLGPVQINLPGSNIVDALSR